MPSSIRRYLTTRRLWLIVLFGYWLALFVATHLPVTTPGLPGQGVDKLVHVAAFAVLAVVFAVAWRTVWGRLEWRHLLAMWLVIALYAAIDERTQDWVGRYASVTDWLADVVGAAIGLIGVRWWVSGLENEEPHSSRLAEKSAKQQ